jgi:hypothetical protein
MKKRSPTYNELVFSIHKLREQAIDNNIYSNTITSSGYERIKTGNVTSRIPQPIVISVHDLHRQSTLYEWDLIGIISDELKEYNCLWYCSPDLKKKNTYRNAIAGLIKRNILTKTETTNIYLVNPLYIRRGDIFGVLSTTANMLEDEVKVGVEHITNKRPIKSYSTIQSPIMIEYGYMPSDVN